MKPKMSLGRVIIYILLAMLLPLFHLLHLCPEALMGYDPPVNLDLRPPDPLVIRSDHNGHLHLNVALDVPHDFLRPFGDLQGHGPELFCDVLAVLSLFHRFFSPLFPAPTAPAGRSPGSPSATTGIRLM